jgi:TRAP-type C4-dicarboxylate transport system substrate-binding protein
VKPIQILVSLALALTAAGAQADVTIKLGTLAPNGSTWHNLLKEMGEKWAEASGGQVKLKIYAGGTLGNEGDMVRKMAVGQLQSAAITSVGMHEIIKEPQTLSVPMMIDSDAEFDYVLPKVQGRLESLFEKKGYVVLTWGQVGYSRFFCTKPYQTPAEMADAKIFAWEGDPASVEAWKAAGFRPVVLSSTDMLTSLQTGMIDCITNPPLYTFTARLFEKAKHMVDVNWGLLIGATIVKKKDWEKIPADTRAKLLAIAREVGQRTDVEVRKMNAEALETMKKQGLNAVKPADVGAWRKAAESAWPAIRGKVVPADFFDEVKRLRDAYRGQAKAEK